MRGGRIFLALGGVTFLSLLIFISISYYSYVDSASQQDFFHLKQFGHHIQNDVNQMRKQAGGVRPPGFHHEEYEIFVFHNRTGPIGLSQRSERYALLEQLFPFQRLVQLKADTGSVKLKGDRYHWSKLPLQSPNEYLFLIHQSEDLVSLFISGFGPSLAVFSLFLGWCAIWGSLILNNLFRKLHDKTDLLQSQTKEIIKARDAAFAADQAKSRFLANISHELRTPLTAIIGFSESMYEENATLEQRQNHLETIIRNSNYLLHIINELLDLSKIDEDKLVVETIAFSPVLLLKDVENLVRQQIESKGLEFKVNFVWPLPGKVQGDPLRVKQVVINLCANAMKFTERGYIHITVDYVQEKALWRIVVNDSGIGIGQEQQKVIFAPFVQADISITRKYGGTGLGLSLTKRLVELMGGTITLSSQPDKGSQFVIELPSGEVDSKQMLTAEYETRIATDPFSVDKVVNLSGRVLVAEDAPDSQILVRAMLEKAGLTVKVVGDGKQAVEAAQQDAWDLILMDMQMPVMDGITALQTLRQKGFRIPVVALTANTSVDDRALYAEAGFDDFVGKPIRRRILYQILGKYLAVLEEPVEEIVSRD